jgi:hypothetical protein
MGIKQIGSRVKSIRFMKQQIPLNLNQISQLLVSNRNIIKILEDLLWRGKMKIEVEHHKITTLAAKT